MRHIEAEIQSIPKLEIDIGPVSVLADAPAYDGPYEVTPKVEEQILDTSGKIMTDTVTVHQVPVWRTANGTGGNTVYIAAERSK